MSERTGAPRRLVVPARRGGTGFGVPPVGLGSGGIRGFVDEPHRLHEEGERALLDPLRAGRAPFVELEPALPEARDREERLFRCEAPDPGVLDVALAEADARLARLGADDELARLPREV